MGVASSLLLFFTMTSLTAGDLIKVRVKSILNVCSEFVTQQKNVLLTTQTNLNDKKNTPSN